MINCYSGVEVFKMNIADLFSGKKIIGNFPWNAYANVKVEIYTQI